MPASVTTQHNDVQRTGVNPPEVTLTKMTVGGLHRVAELAVDPPQEGGPMAWQSQIVAQPLLAADAALADRTRKDLLIVCTMHGTVYAFEAGHGFGRVWATWLGPPYRTFWMETGTSPTTRTCMAPIRNEAS